MPTGTSTKSACMTLTWVFALIAAALILGYYLFYSAGHGNPIDNRPPSHTSQ